MQQLRLLLTSDFVLGVGRFHDHQVVTCLADRLARGELVVEHRLHEAEPMTRQVNVVVDRPQPVPARPAARQVTLAPPPEPELELAAEADVEMLDFDSEAEQAEALDFAVEPEEPDSLDIDLDLDLAVLDVDAGDAIAEPAGTGG